MLGPRWLNRDARCPHHTVEVGGPSSGSPLTQSTFSRALRVLKCKPITRRGHPDPAPRVSPFLLLCLWWHRAQPRLVRDEPEPLCSESTLSPCLSFPPMCPTEAHRQQHLGCSLSLAGCAGAAWRGACPWCFFTRAPVFAPVFLPKTEQLFSHTVMGDSPILPGSEEEAGGHLSAGFCQGLARLVSALNCLEVRRDGAAAAQKLQAE